MIESSCAGKIQNPRERRQPRGLWEAFGPAPDSFVGLRQNLLGENLISDQADQHSEDLRRASVIEIQQTFGVTGEDSRQGDTVWRIFCCGLTCHGG